jgi:hypothetical protein
MHIITKIGFTALLFATSTLGIGNIGYTEAPIMPYTATSTVGVQKIWTIEDTRLTVAQKALEYGVDKELMMALIECETSHKIASTTIQSGYYKDGVREESYGLVQIHLPSWVGKVTYAQAVDPVFAIDFMAKKISEGKVELWSCHKLVG